MAFTPEDPWEAADRARAQDQRDQGVQTLMQDKDGAAAFEPVYADYFGTDERFKVQLPDGVSWVEVKVLNEGERRKIQNGQHRDMRVQKATQDLVLRTSPGDDRMVLLKEAICDWNLQRNGGPLPFKPTALQTFLDKAPPVVIDLIQKEVYKRNPWLMQDLSVEDIDKQIAELQEMREVKVREEEGKDSSS